MPQLNEEQKIAAKNQANSLLVLAGPGTGKTSTLIGRYVHLVNEGVRPERILCCAFSKKASTEIEKRLKEEKVRSSNVTTFHALGLKIVNDYGHLINVSAPKKILSSMFERVSIIRNIRNEMQDKLQETPEDKKIQDSEIIAEIDIFRQKLLDPEDAIIRATERSSHLSQLSARIYAYYEKHLTDNTLIDFERMIQWSTKTLEVDARGKKEFVSKFDHVLVDEFQDINFSQKVMLDLILKGGANYWVVGDDDQAIYGWRGSDVDFILNFDTYYPGSQKVQLLKNYRSGSTIISLSSYLASGLTTRHKKELIAAKQDKGKVSFLRTKNESIEAKRIIDLIDQKQTEGVSYKEIAVLGRTNSISLNIILALVENNIPFITKDGSGAFKDKIAKQLLTAIAVSENFELPNNLRTSIKSRLRKFAVALANEDWSRKVKSLSTFTINLAKEDLSEEEVTELNKSLLSHKEYLLSKGSLKRALQIVSGHTTKSDNDNAVHVGTIHGAKGLEWDSVFIIGWEEDLIPHSRALERLDEERRLAYVGLTRAKHHLILSYVKKRFDEPAFPSPFLSDLLKKQIEYKNSNASKDFAGKGQKANIPDTEFFNDEAQKTNQEISEKNFSDQLAQDKSERSEETNTLQGSFDAAEGLLSFAGYSVTKNGPSDDRRKIILSSVFNGLVTVPTFLTDSVLDQWSQPKSEARLRKMRNSLNIFKGLMEGRQNPSMQAIEKWEKDLAYIDEVLAKRVEG